MGLNVSHDAWDGAYSAFSRWRNKIAEVAGYTIADEVKFKDGHVERDLILMDWGRVTLEHLEGKWEKTPEDPLVVLFAHYDTDGYIFPQQGMPLADALEKLLPKLDEPDFGHIKNYKTATERFIKGLRLAAKRNEKLTFR